MILLKIIYLGRNIACHDSCGLIKLRAWLGSHWDQVCTSSSLRPAWVRGRFKQKPNGSVPTTLRKPNEQRSPSFHWTRCERHAFSRRYNLHISQSPMLLTRPSPRFRMWVMLRVACCACSHVLGPKPVCCVLTFLCCWNMVCVSQRCVKAQPTTCVVWHQQVTTQEMWIACTSCYMCTCICVHSCHIAGPITL